MLAVENGGRSVPLGPNVMNVAYSLLPYAKPARRDE